MFPARQTLDTLYDSLGAQADSKKQRVLGVLNARYFDIVRAFPYSAWQRTSLNQTYSGTDGLRLPSCLAGVLDIWDGEGNGYAQRTHEQVARTNNEVLRRWYVSGVSSSALRVVHNVDLTSGTGAVAAGTFSAGEVGEWVSIDGYPAAWQVGTAATITPEWWAPDATAATLQVRPAGTCVIKLVDESGNALSDRSDINVSWWRIPLPVFQVWEMIQLPQIRPLELAVLVTMLDRDKRKGDADAYRREMIEEIQNMQGLEPMPHVPYAPQDITGAPAGWGASGTSSGDECNTWSPLNG